MKKNDKESCCKQQPMEMIKMKKVYKYGTGETIPEGAEYLKTVVEGGSSNYDRISERIIISPRYVWHYFLVEVKE